MKNINPCGSIPIFTVQLSIQNILIQLCQRNTIVQKTIYYLFKLCVKFYLMCVCIHSNADMLFVQVCLNWLEEKKTSPIFGYGLHT